MNKNSYSNISLVAAALVFPFFSNPCLARTQQGSSPVKWPAISELHGEFLINKKSPHLEIGIFSVEGKVVYSLQCHPGDFVDSRGDDYYQLYQCKLTPSLYDLSSTHEDLFMGSGSSNTHGTRASFGFEDVWGPCKNHKYSGRKRVLSMRGMEVKFEISNFSFSDNLRDLIIASDNSMRYKFKLKIDIVNKPNAYEAYAPLIPEYCGASNELDKRGNVKVRVIMGKDSVAE